MKTIGIIGGLGPLAGAHFYRRLVELTPALSDEEHIPVVLVSDPTVPSRIRHLSGQGESPLQKLVEVSHKLVGAGVEAIALPSTTTSIYQPQIAEQVSVPILSLIEQVANAISAQECRRIGVLGTTPTRTFAVYEEAFRHRGIEAVYPDDVSQAEVMDIIHLVKGASNPLSTSQWEGNGQYFGRPVGDGHRMESLRARLADIASRRWSDTLDGVLLGCTELPVLFPDVSSRVELAKRFPVFSSTDILASATVRFALDAMATC